MSDKQTELLAAMADRLGITVEHLWGVLLAQAPISSSCGVLGVLMAMTASAVLFFLARRSKDFDNQFALFLMASIMAGLSVVYFFCEFSSIVSGFANPEYWALKQLLDAAK